MIAGLASAAILLPLFVFVEHRGRAPMLDLTIFRNRMFSAATAAAFINGLSRFALLFVFVFYFQGAQGDDPITAGIKLAPMAIGMLIASPLAGIWADRHGSRTLAALGMLVSAAALALMTTLQADSPYWQSTAWLFLAGVGSGMFQSPNTAAMMGAVPADRRGVAAGARTMLQNTGAVISIAFVLAIVTAAVPKTVLFEIFSGLSSGLSEASLAPFIHNLHTALWALAATSVVGARRVAAATAPPARGRRCARALCQGGMTDKLRIGEVARLTGTTPRTVRYYEEIGLLPEPSQREPGAHRAYTDADVERIRELVHLRDLLGVSLEELRELVAAEDARAALRREWRSGVEDPARRREILEEALAHVDRQLGLVRRRRDQIAQLERELSTQRRRIGRRLGRLQPARHSSVNTPYRWLCRRPGGNSLAYAQWSTPKSTRPADGRTLALVEHPGQHAGTAASPHRSRAGRPQKGGARGDRDPPRARRRGQGHPAAADDNLRGARILRPGRVRGLPGRASRATPRLPRARCGGRRTDRAGDAVLTE